MNKIVAKGTHDTEEERQRLVRGLGMSRSRESGLRGQAGGLREGFAEKKQKRGGHSLASFAADSSAFRSLLIIQHNVHSHLSRSLLTLLHLPHTVLGHISHLVNEE